MDAGAPNPFDAERERVIDQRANGFITEREKREALAEIDRVEAIVNEQKKVRHG